MVHVKIDSPAPSNRTIFLTVETITDRSRCSGSAATEPAVALPHASALDGIFVAPGFARIRP